MLIDQLPVPPELHFGTGKFLELPNLIATLGKKVLVVTGQHSFLSSAKWPLLENGLIDRGIVYELFKIDQEPSPSMIDDCVQEYAGKKIEVVVGIGGGSVLDAGKAISAMLPIGGPVINYLEGVGTLNHPGTKVPFIAVPTTSGTGSEATKNAVLSEVGAGGFKKSLRHANFVPNIALLDPELTLDCPQTITASSGMDAFTQLLESYLSTSAKPMTDAFAMQGLALVEKSLVKAYWDGEHDLQARSDMAMASFLSGICLANAGLGLVHGFAGAIGGLFFAPHGIICSALMHPANLLTVRKLRAEGSNPGALAKYANVGRLFSKENDRSDDFYTDFLLYKIAQMTSELRIPRLSDFRIGPEDIRKIVAQSDNKSNPVVLNEEEMTEVLELAIL